MTLFKVDGSNPFSSSKEEKMEEQKSSFEQMQEDFIKKGGIRLSSKEWDKIFEGVDRIVKKRWSENSKAVDDKQHYAEYDFLTEIYLSRNKLTFKRMEQSRKQNKNGAVVAIGHRNRWNSDCLEIYVCRDDEGTYHTFFVKEEEGIERESERPEVVGYLCMKLLSGELSLEEVLTELLGGDE